MSHNLCGPPVAPAMKPTKQQEGCDEAALFFSRLPGDATRSLTGWCREDSRLIFNFMSTTPPWPVSGPMCCTFNARTAERNMRHETEVQRLAAKPFSLEPLKRNARGISTPRWSVAQSR